MILFLISLVAGILTVFAPCILPLLPVIVGSSVSGVPSKKKALIISISLGLSVIVFTLLLKVSTFLISVPQSAWSIISGIIIILFGIVSLAPGLWQSLPFVSWLNRDSNKLLATGYKKENIWGDIIIGAALGPVFSTCSPTYFVILATVLPRSLSLGLLDLLAYAFGLSATLLLIAFAGQKLVAKSNFLSNDRGAFRRVLGLIFILLGIAVAFGWDKQAELAVTDSGVFDITKVEQYLLSFNANSVPATIATTTQSGITKMHGPLAPELQGIAGYINTGGQPITLAQYRGKKVVLLDIWTYSCINCQRTLPYVESWYEKYKDMGLVVIGVHTPEFSFEKVQSNVEDAVKRFGLTYPVVLDNSYATWNAYGNEYWPRKYLINENGEIIYDHIGEGNYDETEMVIQKALSELNQKQINLGTTTPKNVIAFDPSKVQSPETYFGAKRNEYLANGRPGTEGQQTLTLPDSLQNNALYLSGMWNFTPEYAESISAGKIIFKYNAKNVYMVASSKAGVTVTVRLDGDKAGVFSIQANKLYTLIQSEQYGEHTLEIDVPPGLQAFTFTFG